MHRPPSPAAVSICHVQAGAVGPARQQVHQYADARDLHARGIGAVAYNAIVAQRPAEDNTIAAFSGGSLLNLAQGKFGRYNENEVRWLAAASAPTTAP